MTVVVNATIDLSSVIQSDIFVSVFDSVLGELSNVTVVGEINILNYDDSKVLHLSRFMGSYLKEDATIDDC